MGGKSSSSNNSGGGTSTGGGGTSTANLPSWEGGSSPKDFDAKLNGTTLFSDLMKVYKQGPQTYDQALFTPYSATTTNQINTGLGDIEAMRDGVVGDVAAGDWLNGNNPYFEQALSTARENVGRDVNSTFNSNGLFGSDLHARGLAEGMGNVETQARLANNEQEYSRMLGAQGALQQGVATGLGYGGLLDSKAREQMLADYDLFNRQKDADYEHVARTIGTLTGGQGGAQENTNQASSGWDLFGTVASVAGAALPWLLPMLSDERAKTDIRRVGETDDGTNIYTYRYKSGGPVQMGVMAQEVRKKQPEAVSEFPGTGGLLGVNYARVR